MDTLSFIMALEAGEIETQEELAHGMQALIDNGSAWTMQGFYGRLAKQLIEEGACHD